MKNETLEIRCKLQIAKPVAEVFDAIVDPVKMAGYFLEKGSGPLESGKTVYWKFPEFNDEFPVKTEKVEPDQLVSLSWGSDAQKTTVDFLLEPVDNGSQTLITVTEKSRPNNEAGIKWLKDNTEGWANFLACMKASLEYGINLRKGAFDFLKK